MANNWKTLFDSIIDNPSRISFEDASLCAELLLPVPVACINTSASRPEDENYYLAQAIGLAILRYDATMASDSDFDPLLSKDQAQGDRLYDRIHKRAETICADPMQLLRYRLLAGVLTVYPDGQESPRTDNVRLRQLIDQTKTEELDLLLTVSLLNEAVLKEMIDSPKPTKALYDEQLNSVVSVRKETQHIIHDNRDNVYIINHTLN